MINLRIKCIGCEKLKTFDSYLIENKCYKNICRECNLYKKYKRKKNTSMYPILPFDFTSYEWQVGKPSGFITTENNYSCRARLRTVRKSKSKVFKYDKYNTMEEAWYNANEWLTNISTEFGLTRNRIKKINNQVIEIKLTNNKSMFTDINYLNICQIYPISVCSSNRYCRIYINNTDISFHTYITGFVFVDHINRNPFDNRICNLEKSTNKLNSNNRNISISNTSGYTGVLYTGKSWIAHIKQDGITYSKNFSVNKYGNDLAKEYAISKRMEYNKFFGSKNGLDPITGIMQIKV